MELPKESDDLKKYDDTKVITAIVCLFIGFLIVWNIAAHVTAIYELYLDTETCNKVKTLGLAPSANCAITAPYRPFGITPGGYLTLPDGKELQIVPVTANQTNKNTEWSTFMRVQFWVALLFWAATLGLLVSTFFHRKK
jgi:hypothetical protein